MKIFTYGTLMRGFGNHPLLEDSPKLYDAFTRSQFTMLHLGGFPGIVRVGDTAIKGEVYAVDYEVLESLDRLEGHPHFYRREVIEARPVGTEDWEWVVAYILPADWLDISTVIKSGDWMVRGIERATIPSNK